MTAGTFGFASDSHFNICFQTFSYFFVSKILLTKFVFKNIMLTAKEPLKFWLSNGVWHVSSKPLQAT
jgi:hypothetical protein